MSRPDKISKRSILMTDDGTINIKLTSTENKYYLLPVNKSLVINQVGKNLNLYLQDSVTGKVDLPEAWFKSAYEIAVSNGFVGTELEWLTSLIGEPGYTPIKGVDYVDGTNGREIQLQVSDTAVQWKYSTELIWHDLVLLEYLKGEQGIQGERGLQGPKGDTGLTGDRGPTGLTGSTGPAGAKGNTGASITSAAFVSNDIVFTKDDANTVTLTNAKVTLKGDQGIQGPAGVAGTKGDTGSQGPQGNQGNQGNIGATGASITSAAFVSNDIVFTKNDTNTVTLSGAKTTLKGDQGIQGNTGNAGTAATVAVGTVTTLTPGSSATVANGGSSSAAVFNFGIPKGDTTYTGNIDGGNSTSVYTVIVNAGSASSF